MKDYSNYIPNSFGFITKLEIVGDKIHVWTPENKKGEPHKYGIEELSRFQSRLETQYKLILKNKDIIKEDRMKKINKILTTIGFVICTPIVLAIALAAILVSTKYSLALAIPAAIVISEAIISQRTSKRIDEEMITYELYLKERASIESLSKKDENITEHLSKRTNQRIKTNAEMQEQGIINEVFNIDFMDKTSLQQLQKLLTKYQISKSLQLKQSFVNPHEEEVRTKSRTRTKNNEIER